MKAPDDDQLSDADTERRRDDALRRALNTPPQPKQKAAPESRQGRPRKA
jgi:hypothetical protein